jgi:outer membrane protein assembly factor BamB
VFATPAIARGVAFVVTNEPSLTAFDLKTGAELWQRDVGGESSPAASDGVILLGGDDQSLRALDVDTGETRWSSPLGYAIRSSATFTNDAVFIGSGPTLNAIDLRDGSTLWTHVTGGEITADLAVVANMVIASSHDGYVYALAPAGHEEFGTAELSIRARGVLLGASR